MDEGMHAAESEVELKKINTKQNIRNNEMHWPHSSFFNQHSSMCLGKYHKKQLNSFQCIDVVAAPWSNALYNT